MGVNEKILEAIGICADNIVKKAGYNKTIQAQIMSCQDATIGKYKCKFQDAIFYAYNTNTEVSYTKGTNVYVLIPSNDMGKEKIILGATKKLGINYISQANDDEAYELVGQNCIDSNKVYYLDTKYINYTYDIYNYERDKDNGIIDIKTLEYNLKHSTSMLVGATIKTNIEIENQHNGHYGIIYKLVFQDNVTKAQTMRPYVLDEDDMVSNPYKLVLNTRQYKVFNIDGDNFIRIESITIFNTSFPGSTKDWDDENQQKPIKSGDIILSNFQLYGANALSQQQINGITITFYTPQGIFFTNSEMDNQKTIIAQVRVKSKLVSSAQDIPFFWGRQNIDINTKSKKYNKYLGRGWQCFNPYNIIKNQQQEEEIDWVPMQDTFILSRDDALAVNNRIKVAIVYDNNVITKTINIQNKSKDAINISIESSEGTEFHHDIGHPDLTCLINGEEKFQEKIGNKIYKYVYKWGYDSKSELTQQLENTEDINFNYDNAKKNLDNIVLYKDSILKYEQALEDIKKELSKYNNIQRIHLNKIFNVQIRQIVNFKTFKCSVFKQEYETINNKEELKNNYYLGTAQITLTNKLDGQDLYSLIINNGSVVYQYNENGVAPTKNMINPQSISALTFSLYDNNGKLIDSESLIESKDCRIEWKVPLKNTLLVPVLTSDDKSEDEKDNVYQDENEEYQYYINRTNLLYNIEDWYNINHQNNQIILNVNYKGKNITTKTNFTFTKQGQPGTNGTEYTVRIVPNTSMTNPPLYPVITKYFETNNYSLNYGIDSEGNESFFPLGKLETFPFIAQLWYNGQNIENTNNVGTFSDKKYQIKWEILREVIQKNGDNIIYNHQSNFNIKENKNEKGETIFSFLLENKPFEIDDENIFHPANIIKCTITVNGKSYYGTIPIITVQVPNENYRIFLKENSGFKYVMYSSDGLSPQYDTSYPFEIICKQKFQIDEGKYQWQDISILKSPSEGDPIFNEYNNDSSTKDLEYIFGYQSSYYYFNKNIKELEQLSLLNLVKKDDIQKNQKWYKPIDIFNGYCTNIAVTCIIQDTDPSKNFKGYIRIPIHFLLNKYGLAHLNEWDGNSIQINQDGGYILAPQMGAGTKNNQNNFTGVLMGEIIQGKRIDNGLMGYREGKRTFFLDSETGAAFFGQNGPDQGQIIIDPGSQGSVNKALIYSSNFFVPENYNEKGFPKSYAYRDGDYNPSSNIINENHKGQGMVINLSLPQIYFGSGSFYVTREGHIHAAGGGDIAGWKINDNQIYTNYNNNPVLTLQSTSFPSFKRINNSFKTPPEPPKKPTVDTTIDGNVDNKSSTWIQNELNKKIKDLQDSYNRTIKNLQDSYNQTVKEKIENLEKSLGLEGLYNEKIIKEMLQKMTEPETPKLEDYYEQVSQTYNYSSYEKKIAYYDTVYSEWKKYQTDYINEQNAYNANMKKIEDYYNKWKTYYNDRQKYETDIINFETNICKEVKTNSVYLKSNEKDPDDSRKYIYYYIGQRYTKNGKEYIGLDLTKEINGVSVKDILRKKVEKEQIKFEHINYFGYISNRSLKQSEYNNIINEQKNIGDDKDKVSYIKFLKGYVLYILTQSEAKKGRIYSNVHDQLTNTSDGFYLSDDGFSIGSKVLIKQDGSMCLGNGAVAENKNSRYWKINVQDDQNNTAISYGTKGNYNSVYLGTDQISLGSTFSVNNKGYLVAESGTIGSWNIDDKTISSNSLILNSNGSIEGNNWKIDASGFHSTSNNHYNDFKLDGNQFYSSGGIIGANGSGCLGGTNFSNSPLSWTPETVTLRGNARLVGGAKIGKLNISPGGEITGTGYIYITHNSIRVKSIQADSYRVGGETQDEYRSGRTGTVTFSDGSTMEFGRGLLLKVKQGSEMKSASGDLLN